MHFAKPYRFNIDEKRFSAERKADHHGRAQHVLDLDSAELEAAAAVNTERRISRLPDLLSASPLKRLKSILGGSHQRPRGRPVPDQGSDPVHAVPGLASGPESRRLGPADQGGHHDGRRR